MNEIKEMLMNFFEENENGMIHLMYPVRLDATGGIEISKDMLSNDNKIKFMKCGILIYQTMGYSLITNKHLFLPYGECVFIFLENE